MVHCNRTIEALLRAAYIPGSDEKSEHTFNDETIELKDDFLTDVKLPKLPQKVQTLLCLLSDRCYNVLPPQ
jgi:hypothetical protein